MKVANLAWATALLILSGINSMAQCGTDPGISTTTIASANQIVNSYYPGTGNPATGGTSLVAGTLDARGSATALANGDLVLIIQMQGADINTTNTDAYGDGVSGAPASGNLSTNLYAGYYEYNTVTSFVASTITFTYSLANNYYTQSFSGSNSIRTYQVIRIPRYYDLAINSGASITAPAWNGATGGVVALDAANTLTVNGSVNVSALGFRAGGGKNFTGAGAGNTNGSTGLVNTDYRWNSPVTTAANTTGGAMGEGIAGTPVYVLPQSATTTTTNGVEGYVNGSLGRGAPANGGGGATDGAPVGAGNNQFNSGGGGGANAGDGGNGGSGWHGGAGNASTYPYGGYGGINFSQRSIRRIIAGGGGGAGTANNSNGTNEYQSSGGSGGGIIFMRAKLYAGTGSIVANGGDAPGVVGVGGTSNTDAAGGGGGGGSILVVTRQTGATGLGTITASAAGGKGGDMTNYYDHGPGGGGGGGFIISNGSFASTAVTAGVNGKTRTGSPAGAITNNFGAASGTAGQILTLAKAPGLSNSNNLSSPCGPLPVTLINFSGVANNNSVTLSWEVQSAIRFSYFDIEYSTDGSNFIWAGTENYLSSVDRYHFTHQLPGSPVVFYRLKLVDEDGYFHYSKTIAIRLDAANTSVSLFPNPAHSATTLRFTASGNLNSLLTVTDQNGREIRKLQVQARPGTNFISIDCTLLAPGTYFIKLAMENSATVRQRLVVVPGN